MNYSQLLQKVWRFALNEEKTFDLDPELAAKGQAWIVMELGRDLGYGISGRLEGLKFTVRRIN
jgi:hypothetical protein